MKTEKFKFGDLVGAFADSAILFPLIALLSTKAGFNSSTLFLTSGLAYIVSAFVFRIPMPVQPLKSIAIAAIAVGASMAEVRFSGALLGIACLCLIFMRMERLAIHKDVIQSIQAGLGTLLLLQGFKTLTNADANIFFVIILSLSMIAADLFSHIPLLGLTATAAVFYALFKSNTAIVQHTMLEGTIRPWMIASLVLPQIALTSANSVLGTTAVAKKYFEDKSKYVTVKNILLSVGIGNLIAALVSGLPWCHGAGGLTAHYKGGARSYKMGFVIGTVLIFLAVFSYYRGSVQLILPVDFISALLFTIGFFHFKLATETWRSTNGRLLILISVIVTLATSNLLYCLIALVLIKASKQYFKHA